MATISGDNTICAGTSSTITVTLTGGTGDYTVTYNSIPHTGPSPITFNVLPSTTTTYHVSDFTVTDANGCTNGIITLQGAANDNTFTDVTSAVGIVVVMPLPDINQQYNHHCNMQWRNG